MFWDRWVFPYDINADKWWVSDSLSYHFHGVSYGSVVIQAEIHKWLIDNFDQNTWKLCGTMSKVRKIRFKNQHDAISFKLMWYR